MKSFALGLALLISGFTLYMVSTAIKNIGIFFQNVNYILQKLAEAGVIPANITVPAGLGTLSVGIPQGILNIVPYLALGVMAFGIGWFWLIEPVLYLSTPPKRQAEAPPISARRVETGPSAPRGKDLEQWIAEAIREKMERERGR